MVTNVGVVQTIYTVEPNPEDEATAIVTYWLPNGQKIGSMTMQKGE